MQIDAEHAREVASRVVPAAAIFADREEHVADMRQRAVPHLLAYAEEVRNAVVNSPETADFMAGVPLEAAHQRERWGADHDAGKSPFDWFWLVGYLAQKAADAAVRGDAEKAKHHTISTAAALANWHAQISGRTDMRPGIEPGNGGQKPGSAYDLASKLETAK